MSPSHVFSSTFPILAFWEGGTCVSLTQTQPLTPMGNLKDKQKTKRKSNLTPLTCMPLWEEAGVLTHREKWHKEMMRDACWEVTVCLNCKCIMHFNLSGSSPVHFQILHHHTSLQKTRHVHPKWLQASGTHTNCLEKLVLTHINHMAQDTADCLQFAYPPVDQ